MAKMDEKNNDVLELIFIQNEIISNFLNFFEDYKFEENDDFQSLFNKFCLNYSNLYDENDFFFLHTIYQKYEEDYKGFINELEIIFCNNNFLLLGTNNLE